MPFWRSPHQFKWNFGAISFPSHPKWRKRGFYKIRSLSHICIPAIVMLPSNVLYFRVSGLGYSWNLSTQNNCRYLHLAVPTHLQISSAPLCLRAASGTSARFSNPLLCLENYFKEICVPSLWNSSFLMLSNAKQANLQYIYMMYCHSNVYSTILMSGFVIKENTENVEPFANFFSGTLVSS